MLKKILYIVASFLVGFLLIMYSITYNTYTTLQSFVKEAINNGEYTEVERYFSSAIDTSSKFIKDAEDGTHIEIYYALNEKTEYILDAEGKATSTTYYAVESGVQFALFKLADTFKLSNDEEKVGGVNLVYENGEKILFPFVTETTNYYDTATNYSVLLLSVSYSDYTKALEKNESVSKTDSIVSAEFVDGTGEPKYIVEFTDNNLSFENQFHTAFAPVLKEYNKVQKEYAEGTKITEEDANKIKNDYEAIFAANEGYVLTHDSSKIYGSSKFLVGVISTAVIFLALDILVAWLIFRKKKPAKYIPPYKQTQKPVAKEPEQFNRSVFDLEADEVVEAVAEMNSTPTEEPTNE